MPVTPVPFAHYKLVPFNYTSKTANFLCMAYATRYRYTEGWPSILIPGVEYLMYHITDRELVEGQIINKLPGI